MRLLCIVLLASVHSAFAQVQEGVALQQYVFDKFYNGSVKTKSGETFEKSLNYNIVTGEMIFDNDGQYLALAAPENVDTVTINGRKFVPFNKKFYEVLILSAAPLLMEFTFSIKQPGSPAGYGGESTTTASTAYKSLVNSGGAYNLKLPEGFTVTPGYTYWIIQNGEAVKAGSVKQLMKIFPGKKEVISQKAAANHTNFSRREDVVELVKQIEGA